MGRLARRLETPTREFIRWPLIAGATTAIVVYTVSYFVPWFLIRYLKTISPSLADAVAVVVVYTAIALGSLLDHSRAVFNELYKLRLKEARSKVSMIVGRDTDRLSRREV